MRLASAICGLLLLSTGTARADLIMTVTPEQYGAVGDCVADDTNAFLAMRTNLRAFQDANAGSSQTIRQVMQLGGYGKCYAINDVRYIWGLKNLYIYGGGARIMNYYPSYYFQMGSPPAGPYYTYDKDGNPLQYNYTGVTPVGSGPLGAEVFNRGMPTGWEGCTTYTSSLCVSGWTGASNPLLQTANAGASQVTTINAADANPAVFAPGLAVMVASYSKMMYNSYPTAYKYVDWAKVISADPSTGNIVLDRPLQYTHLPNLPIEGYVANGYHGATPGTGPARIHLASHPTMGMGDILWIENVRFDMNPHSGRSTYTSPTVTGNDYPQTYFSWVNGMYVLLSGYFDITMTNVEAPNISPTSAPHFHFNNSKFYGGGELDKDINSVEVNNSSFALSIGGMGPILTTINSSSFAGPSYNNAATFFQGDQVVMNNGAIFVNHAVSPYMGNYGMANTFGTTGITMIGTAMIGNGVNTPYAITVSAPGPAGTPLQTITLDGTTYLTSGGNVVDFTDLSPTKVVTGNPNGAGNLMMRCLYPGSPIYVAQGGNTYVGTVNSMVQDTAGALDPTLNAHLGALLTLIVPGVTVNNGDTLNCYPRQPGSVVTSGVTYRNFSQVVLPP